jgi:hypothetical protein
MENLREIDNSLITSVCCCGEVEESGFGLLLGEESSEGRKTSEGGEVQSRNEPRFMDHVCREEGLRLRSLDPSSIVHRPYLIQHLILILFVGRKEARS